MGLRATAGLLGPAMPAPLMPKYLLIVGVNGAVKLKKARVGVSPVRPSLERAHIHSSTRSGNLP